MTMILSIKCYNRSHNSISLNYKLYTYTVGFVNVGTTLSNTLKRTLTLIYKVQVFFFFSSMALMSSWLCYENMVISIGYYMYCPALYCSSSVCLYCCVFTRSPPSEDSSSSPWSSQHSSGPGRSRLPRQTRWSSWSHPDGRGPGPRSARTWWQTWRRSLHWRWMGRQMVWSPQIWNMTFVKRHFLCKSPEWRLYH